MPTRLNPKPSAGGSPDPALVLVQAPWCPYCKMMRPEWDDLRKDLSTAAPHVQVVEYDRDALEDMRTSDPKDPIIDALDAREETGVVTTVPHIALVVFADDGTPREVYSYSEYVHGLQGEGHEEAPEPRTKKSWLRFLRDTLEKSLPNTSLKQTQTTTSSPSAGGNVRRSNSNNSRSSNNSNDNSSRNARANGQQQQRQQQRQTSSTPSSVILAKQEGGGKKRQQRGGASSTPGRKGESRKKTTALSASSSPGKNNKRMGGGGGPDDWRRR